MTLADLGFLLPKTFQLVGFSVFILVFLLSKTFKLPPVFGIPVFWLRMYLVNVIPETWTAVIYGFIIANKSNNKITELRTILQRKSQNS